MNCFICEQNYLKQTFHSSSAQLQKAKVIYISSPLKGDIAANIARAREYCKNVLEAGHIPYAPHVAFEGILDDNNPQERETALKISAEMVKRCNELWVFGNTISEGMKAEIEVASRENISIRFYGAKAAINTDAARVEEQLSKKQYNEFIQELIAEDDYEHPTYEEWRKEMELHTISAVNELKKNG